MKGHENETDQERFSRSRKKRVDSLSEEALSQISDQAIKCVDPKTQEVKLRCKLCRKREFRMISSFEKHIQDHNSGRIKKEECIAEAYDCDECDKTFNSVKRLTRHKLTHTSKPATVFACGKCNKSFRWKSCLHAHVKKCTVNKGAEKRKARLKAKEKLMRHLRNMTDEDEEEQGDEEYHEDGNEEEVENEEEIAEEQDNNEAEAMNDEDEHMHNNEEEPLFAVQRSNELQFTEHQTGDSDSPKEDTTPAEEQVTELLLVQIKEVENEEIPVEIKNEATNNTEHDSESFPEAVCDLEDLNDSTEAPQSGSSNTEETTVQDVATAANVQGEEANGTRNDLITARVHAIEHQKQDEMVNIVVSVGETVDTSGGVVSLSEEALATVQITLTNATEEGQNEML